MTKQAIEKALREQMFSTILPSVDAAGYDALQVSASEYAIPVVTPEGDETYVVIKVSVPRGTRIEGGYEPYDGYAAAEDYKAQQEEKAAKAKASAEKKAQKAKEAEERKAAKKAIKTMKQDIAEVLPSAVEE